MNCRSALLRSGGHGGDVQKIIDTIKELKSIVALTLRDNYLVVSIGPSLEALEKLDKGERLIDRAEFKPLAKFADKKLTSIHYRSEALDREIANTLLKLVGQLLPQSGSSDQQTEQTRNGRPSVCHGDQGPDVKSWGTMALSFLVDQGVEAYRYSWGKHGNIDGSQPLGLLEHVGGCPLFGVVARKKISVKDYDRLADWAKTTYASLKEVDLPAMPETDREKTQKALDAAIPLIERMDKVNREMLFPAWPTARWRSWWTASRQTGESPVNAAAEETGVGARTRSCVWGDRCGAADKGDWEYREIVNGLIGAARKNRRIDVPKGTGDSRAEGDG